MGGAAVGVRAGAGATDRSRGGFRRCGGRRWAAPDGPAGTDGGACGDPAFACSTARGARLVERVSWTGSGHAGVADRLGADRFADGDHGAFRPCRAAAAPARNPRYVLVCKGFSRGHSAAGAGRAASGDAGGDEGSAGAGGRVSGAASNDLWRAATGGAGLAEGASGLARAAGGGAAGALDAWGVRVCAGSLWREFLADAGAADDHRGAVSGGGAVHAGGQLACAWCGAVAKGAGKGRVSGFARDCGGAGFRGVVLPADDRAGDRAVLPELRCDGPGGGPKVGADGGGAWAGAGAGLGFGGKFPLVFSVMGEAR